jgi:lysyl-tRNA synthetase, class II
MGEQDLINERKEKLLRINQSGINPYPYSFKVTLESEKAKSEMKKGNQSLAGRIMQVRRMGRVTFMHVQDSKGKLQFYFKEDVLGKNPYKKLRLLDLGDFIGAKGELFKTKTGEITLAVKKYEILCKSIRPLPEKFHGLQDPEIRFRKRHLDFIMNKGSREIIIQRSIIISEIRKVLERKKFIEIETPQLQTQYGGANARPFKTHLNALDLDLFLSISPELYLKRLIVGGFDRVFTLSRVFRNEGMDRSHNPEFTMMEAYQSYADYNDMMKLVEEFCAAACKKIHGSTSFEKNGIKLDFSTPWKKMSMNDAIKKYAKVDVDKLSDEELFKLRLTYNINYDGKLIRGKMVELLFEELVEDKLIQPTHIIDYPKESTPLCKSHRKFPNLIERFESYVLGSELTNGYSELNDPILQRKLLEAQAKELRAGDSEAHPMDEDFVNAIETGMPPTGGVGVGVDRLVIALTNADSIREAIPFPTMKPDKL